MTLRLNDQISFAGSGVNEDRVTLSANLAWVIDGATDVHDEPLTSAATDADWIASTLDSNLRAYAAVRACAFSDLPQHLTANLSDAFAAEARRQPRARHEHPSASGLIVRYHAGVLSYISIGDCTMLLDDVSDSGFRRCGVAADEAGDSRLAPIIHAHLETKTAAAQGTATNAVGDLRQSQIQIGCQSLPESLAESSAGSLAESLKESTSLLQRMRPVLEQQRARMNLADGYGVISITPTPDAFVRTGFVSLSPGARILLATDGFMRLVDVFGRYDAPALLAAAGTRGLSGLLAELRQLEGDARAQSARPRIKASDDASALLIEVVA